MTGVDVKQQSADHNAQVAAGLGIDADFVVGSIGDAHARQRARRRAGPARLRHRDRRRARAGAGLARVAGARGALLPPRHRSPAADDRGSRRPTRCSPATASCASGSPTPSPTPCAPRCCGARATGSTWWSSSRARTRPATRCCARCGCAARRGRTAGPARARRPRGREYDDLLAAVGRTPRAGGAAQPVKRAEAFTSVCQSP